jgi:hypothetical protein
MLKQYESRAHTIALLVAILGPLINLMLGLNYVRNLLGMYLYWTLCLAIYIVIIIPFTYKSPLTLLRLIILGITVEDFASNLWRSLFLNINFLPFSNWYTEYFPFLGNLGESTIVLIPGWYFLAMLIYILISTFQYRKRLKKLFKSQKELLT